MEPKKYVDDKGAESLMKEVKGKIGNLATLDTDNKSSVVAAINELYNAMFTTKLDVSNWQDSSITIGGYHAFTVANDGTVIAGSNNTGIKYSEDNGKTWQDSNITSGDYIALIVANDGTVIAGSDDDTGIKYCLFIKVPRWEADNSTAVAP